MAEERYEPLSERERELVQLLARGLSNREIANQLYISPNTVKVHLRNIYGKLNVSSRTEATMVAVRMGWVEVERQAGQATKEPGLPDEPGNTAIDEWATWDQHVESQPDGPLALWQRIYLVAAALVVALGLWQIWSGPAKHAEPFTDRPAEGPQWSPGRLSRWQAVAQMPIQRDRLAVVAHQGRLYAIGGETAEGVIGTVEIYWPDDDRWTRGAPKPIPVANVGAVALGNVIYVPGGTTADGQISDHLEVYDPSVDERGAWTTGPRMPESRSAYAIAKDGTTLYVFGGWDGSAYVSTSFRYDPTQETWSTVADMPTPRAFAGAGRIGDRIYVVGGYDGTQELATCEVYHPPSDTWETCPPMNAPRGGIGVAVIADALYVIGGGWENYLVENEYYSPAQGTWRTFPSPILEEWRNLGVASNGTHLYAIGGWDGGFLGVNQAYRAIYRLYMPSTMGQGSAGQ